jgi:hypothetical protein
MATELAAARDELARGRYGPALGHAWDAAARAVTGHDLDGLEEVRALASEVEARSHGRDRDDAQRLVVYCRACRDDLAAGVPPDSYLWRLLGKR